MSKISVYIIGYNEERKIEASIRSVIDWADEVVVADSYSTDETAARSKKLGAVVVQISFEGFGNCATRPSATAAIPGYSVLIQMNAVLLKQKMKY